MATPARAVPTQEDVEQVVATLYEVLDKLELVIAEVIPKLRVRVEIDDEGAGNA